MFKFKVELLGSLRRAGELDHRNLLSDSDGGQNFRRCYGTVLGGRVNL